MNTRILFFDDEKQIAEVLQKNLELYGYKVTLVSTINDFFVEIENAAITYEFVLMDIMTQVPSQEEEKNRFSPTELSNMSNGIRVGEILADKIRSDGKYTNVPILFYSARDNVKPYDNAKFIKKPALAKDIIVEIKSLLEGDTK